MDEALRRPLTVERALSAELAGPALGTRPAALIVQPLRARAIAVPVPTVPGHVGTMLGLSVAGYGVALALVTGLQASTEAAIAADRAPAGAALDRVQAANDRLGAAVDDAARMYGSLPAEYRAIADDLAGIQTRLAALARSVTAVDGASRALPASAPLPPVVGSVRVTARSTTHATSGGSAAP